MKKIKLIIICSLILTLLTGCFEEDITSDKKDKILSAFINQNAYGSPLYYVDTVEFKDTSIIPTDEEYDYYKTERGSIYKISITNVNSYTAAAEKYKDETKRQYYITIRFGYKRNYDEKNVLTSKLNNNADMVYYLPDGTEYDSNRYCYKVENICTTKEIYEREYFDSYSSDKLYIATEIETDTFEFADVSYN